MAKNYTDYRKFYAEHYGIKWDPKKFQVHHIDGDRSNNSIENLVLLPTELHQLFHKTPVHDYSANNEPAETFNNCRARFEKAVFNGGRDWLFSEELPRYLDMMAKMVFWGFIKSRNYQECDNTPITRIEGLWPGISK